MAHVITKIGDVIVQPEVFVPYVIRRTMELSELVRSGVIKSDARLDKLITGGGAQLTMPMWSDLGGRSQPFDDTNPIDANKITTESDSAVVIRRANAWAAHELASGLAGASAMTAIADRVADYWVRDDQITLVKVLNGLFGAASMAGLVLDSSAVNISAKMIIQAKQLLGDAAPKLGAFVVHSMTYSALQAQNLIEYIPNSRGEIVMPAYLGYRVIIDDGCPVAAGVYTSYLFAAGAIARGEGVPVDGTPMEVARDAAMSTDYVFYRRHMVMHPIGTKWKGGTGVSGTIDAELEKGTNWERIASIKHMGIIKMMHKSEF